MNVGIAGKVRRGSRSLRRRKPTQIAQFAPISLTDSCGICETCVRFSTPSNPRLSTPSRIVAKLLSTCSVPVDCEQRVQKYVRAVLDVLRPRELARRVTDASDA